MALDGVARALTLPARGSGAGWPALGFPAARREDPLRRRIQRGCAATLLLLLLGTGILIQADRERTASQAEAAARTALLLARQAETTLLPILDTFAEIEARLREGDPASATLQTALRQVLVRAASDQPFTIAYVVADPEGRVIAASSPQLPAGAPAGGLRTIGAAQEAPSGEIVPVGPFTGVVGLSAGKTVFGFARPILSAAGERLALAGVTVSSAAVGDMLAVPEVLRQGHAELLALDGRRLAAPSGQALPEGAIAAPRGYAAWSEAPPEGRLNLPRGPDGGPALVVWRRVEGLPLLVHITVPAAGVWLGLSGGGLATLGFAALLAAAMLLVSRTLLAELDKRRALEAASARRLGLLAELAQDLKTTLETREILTRLVAAMQRLVPAGEVMAVLMPNEGAEEVVHGRRAAPAPPAEPGAGEAAGRGCPAGEWISAPLRGDAGEWIGLVEVYGCPSGSVTEADRVALEQLAALAETALRRGRLLLQLSATAVEAESARARLEQVCDTIREGFCALDTAGRFTYANPAAVRLLDQGAVPLAGRALAEALPAAAGLLEAARERAAPQEGEFTLPKGRLAQLRLVPTGAGFALFLADTTLAREAERLRQTAERLEAVALLTGGVAHDFNNLLTVVIGNAEALAEALADRAELAQSAGLILGAAERGAALIRRLMAFARRQPLSPSPTHVAALVEDLVPLLQRSLGERVRLVLRLAPGLPPALVDPAQLESAILNLAINARDAMPRGGTLKIELTEEVLDAGALLGFGEATPGRFLRLAVTDDGIGMTAEVARRAFEPFFTTKPAATGSGLGLASVYGFIRQSRGRIALDTAPGRGTRVTLHLPLAAAEDQPAPAAEPPPETPAPPAQPGLHVLLVEDEPALRAQIAAMLGELGHRVTAVAQGEAALEALRAGLCPDLLLSDVVLPGGMDGAAVLREAQALRPGLPAILMSGFAARLYDAEGALPEGLRLLEKPFRRQELAARLEAAVAAGRSRGNGAGRVD